MDSELLCSVVHLVDSAENITYPEFTFPNEEILFRIYYKIPKGNYIYSDGDGGLGILRTTMRVPMLLVTSLATGEVKNFGQYWINNYTSNTTLEYKLYNEFIWYDDTLEAVDYRDKLGDYYFTEGTQTLFWREGWGEDDCWMAFRLGLLNNVHGHNGLGNFVIFKGGYLATDKAVELNSTELISDLEHNVLYIPLVEDKRLFWGESKVKYLVSTNDYLYYAGDMSDVYLAQPSYRNNNVLHKDREFLLLKKELIMAILDRGESSDPSYDKIFQIYLHNDVNAQDNYYRTYNGFNSLLILPAYPDNAQGSIDTYGVPRLRITSATQSRGKVFLNILKVAGEQELLYSAKVTSNMSEIASVLIRGTKEDKDYLIAFSSNLYGGPIIPNDLTLEFIRFNNSIRCYLVDLEPNTEYYIKFYPQGSNTELHISKEVIPEGYSLSSSENGILMFDYNIGGEDQPVLPPTGIKIN